MHHPKADVDRMYVKRCDGGRSLIQLETTYKVATIGLNAYLTRKDDPTFNIATLHEQRKKKYSVAKQAVKLQVLEIEWSKEDTPTTYAKKVKAKAQHQAQEQLKERWKQKEMHGRYKKKKKM